MSTIAELIEAHRAAVAADETSFDDDGKPIDEELAAATEAAEKEALIDFAEAPCRTDADIREKLKYLATGTVGDRSSLLTYLDYYGLSERFIRSLLIEARP